MISNVQQDLQIMVSGNKLEQVKEFVYLGGQISPDGRCEVDIKRRTGQTWAVFNKLVNIQNSHKLTLKTKLHKLTLKTKLQVSESMVISVLMYCSECWTMR